MSKSATTPPPHDGGEFHPRSKWHSAVRSRARCIALITATLPLLLPVSAGARTGSPPIMLERQGAFEAGGEVLREGPATLSCDHGHVEYQIPVKTRKFALFMWHSSSTKVWQSRWDGGEGYQSIFLRRHFPVYLWDGPRVGRANWGCAAYDYKPSIGQDQQNFVAWRLGKRYPNFFPGVQFPVADAAAWDQATRARYQEFDTTPNAKLEAGAAVKALERVGQAVLLTNSAGGMRALLTAIHSDNVKAVIAYENPGYVFPSDVSPPSRSTKFGPIIVSPNEFRRLARIPIQFVFGDNIRESPSWSGYVQTCGEFVRLLNARGGKAEILFLPDVGLRGNTHIPFADLNNVAVADQLSAFLKRHHLDS